MLAVLSDTSTRAEIEADSKQASPTQTIATAETFVRTENGVLVIHATAIAETSAQNATAFPGFVNGINGAIPGVKAIVIDARSATQTDDVAFFFNRLLRQILPQMLDADFNARYKTLSNV